VLVSVQCGALVVQVVPRAGSESLRHRLAVADQMAQSGIPSGAELGQRLRQTILANGGRKLRQYLEKARLGRRGDLTDRLRGLDKLVRHDFIGEALGRVVEHVFIQATVREPSLMLSTGGPPGTPSRCVHQSPVRLSPNCSKESDIKTSKW